MRKPVGICLVCSLLVWVTLCSPPERMAEAFSNRTLVMGSQGQDVKELQGRLCALGLFHSQVDGSFGWDTYWAVRKFQAQFGEAVTGRVDARMKSTLSRCTQNWRPSEASPQSGSLPSQSSTVQVTAVAALSNVGSADGQSHLQRNSHRWSLRESAATT